MSAKVIGIAVILAVVALILLNSGRISNKLIPDVLRKDTAKPSSSPNDLLAMCPTYSYTTDKIELAETRTVSGYTVEFYRNKAYTCARKGYHTFVIAYPQNFSQNSQHSLWIRMHGGSVGAYDQNGNYLPERFCSSPNAPCWIDEESISLLGNFLKETGLAAQVRKENSFRFLVPSMCDHDLYAGIGAVEDKYNPNIDANGNKPRADGMLALRSAIDFTTQKYPSSHVFAHGTSAGSVGAGLLAITLSCEDKNLSGAVMDSGVLSTLTDSLVDAGCSDTSPYVSGLVKTKLLGSSEQDTNGFFLESAIKDNKFKTPLFDFYSKGDNNSSCPGKNFASVKDSTGKTYSGTGAQLVNKKLTEAIEEFGKQTNSTFREVCADSQQNKEACSMHIPTTRSKQITGGDLSRGGEDYNLVIMDWVKERLKDPLPNLW